MKDLVKTRTWICNTIHSWEEMNKLIGKVRRKEKEKDEKEETNNKIVNLIFFRCLPSLHCTSIYTYKANRRKWILWKVKNKYCLRIYFSHIPYSYSLIEQPVLLSWKLVSWRNISYDVASFCLILQDNKENWWSREFNLWQIHERKKKTSLHLFFFSFSLRTC